MTEENKQIDETSISKPFEELSKLPLENISDRDREEARKVLQDIFDRISASEPLSMAEYNIMSNATKKEAAYNAIMYEILGEMDKQTQEKIINNITDVVKRKKERQTATATPTNQSGKNNYKTIFNTLNSLSRVKEPKKSHRKEIAKQIRLLNDELATQPHLFSAAEKKTLSVAYKRYPTEIEEEFKKIENKNTSFVTLYNEVYEKNEPLPQESQQTPSAEERKEVANNLAAILSGVQQYVQEKEAASLAEPTEEAEQEAEVATEPTEEAEQEAEIATEPTEEAEQEAEVATEPTEEAEQEAEVATEPTEEAEQEAEIPTREIVVDFNDDDNTLFFLDTQAVEAHISELKESSTEEEYLASINPKIKTRNIEAAMALEETPAVAAISEMDDYGRPVEEIAPAQEAISALENRSIALANPDDMLVAYNYYTTQYKGKDKDAKIAELKEVINHNLYKYDRKDIDPQNAFALLTLAEKIKDEEDNYYGVVTYNSIKNDIAYSLEEYDRKNFGIPLNGETKEAHAARIEENYTQSLAALEALDPEQTLALLQDYQFTNDNGTPLKNKKRLFSRSSDLEKVQEGILATARMMVATDLAKKGIPADNTDYTSEEQLMHKMQDAIDQIMYKPDGSKTFTTSEIGGRLGASMATKPETFKTRIKQKFKNLPIVKKVTAKFDAIDKKLSENKLFGKAYKIGKKITKIAVKLAPGIAKNTAMFAAAGMVPGGVPALIAYNTYKQWKTNKHMLKDPKTPTNKKIGLLLSTATSMTMATIGVGGLEVFSHNLAGTLTKTGIATLGASMPHIFERASIALKGRKLKKDLAQAVKDNNAKKIAELHQKQKELDKKKSMAGNTLLKIGIGTALGLGISQGLSAAPNNSDNLSLDLTEAENTPNNPNLDDSASQDNILTPETDAAAIETDTASVDTDAASAEAESEQPTAEETAEAEARANNLAAAEEKGSGHMGKSDMESMQKDLDSSHGERMGYTAEEKAALMKALAEGYGTESYEAMHAAMAEPRILAEQMGITAEIEASAQAAGINTSTEYSKAVLNHLATHPELAENDGFKAYVAEHFDEQDRFRFSAQTVNTPQPVHHAPQSSHHAPQSSHYASVQQETTQTTHETKITYEVVDHLPGQHPVQQQTVNHQQTIYTEPSQVHVVHNNPTANLHYDPLLSQNINYEKYSGAYIDPTRIIDGQPAVVYMPVDPIHDKPIVRSMETAMKMHEHAGGDTLGIYKNPTGVDINNPENNYRYGYNSRVCIGTGGITHTTVASNDFGTQLAQHAAARATDIALRQGEHALHHVIDNALGKMRF